MRNNFNSVAGIYDTLSYVVFGNYLKKAQNHFLNKINEKSNLLIIGGGTGWILEAIDAQNLSVTVTYIDSSTAMIKKAKARKYSEKVEVNFIVGSVEDIPKQLYDVIITNFFLDVFTAENLPFVMKTLNNRLVESGVWLCTDFESNHNSWQKLLIKSMYLFFRITARLEANQLLVFNNYFEKLNFEPIERKLFFCGMIESAVYSKMD